jgi:hypothetical protein
MIRSKSLRLRGTALSAAVIFLISSACLVSEIAAQSAESAIAGSSSNPAASSPFLVAPAIPLGYAPSSVATGDLRRVGKLDLVTADYNSGKITVFFGAGQGKFAPGVEYDAGPHPSAVLVADINGDGRPDVLVSNESEGTISVLLGNGDGTLQARQSYRVGFNPSFIATGDLNGSGKVDVAVAGNSGNLLAILLNDGDGNLQKPVLRSLSKTPTALTMADFNNDGRADLALANADGTVSVLLGKGAGLFRSLPEVPVASGSLSSIDFGDLNKDGKIDLVVTQPGRKLVSVLLGNGDGTFASPASYPVGNEPVSALVADINGDGVPALVVINKSSNTFSILGGNGDGTFKASLDFVAGNAPVAAVAGDFYGDGHVDLAVINYSSQTVSVPLGDGDGTFKAARSYAAGVQPASIASGNLNGGKVPALVVANYCGSDRACGTAGSVSVFLADDKGAYRLSSTYTVGAGPVSVALADVNGDRNLDIVALNRLDKTASVLLGAGDGTFRQPMTFPLGGAPIAAAVADLNKDGKLDLAVIEDCGSSKCSQAGSLEILLGGGDGSFQSASVHPVGYSPVSVAVGAIKGGKNLDLVVANRCGKDASCQSAGTATVLIGDGTGKFTPAADIALGKSPASVALANLTGSGLDLVVSRSTDNTVAVLHGKGDGTFQTAVPYAVGNNPGSLVVSDFNGDGIADVAVANVNDSTVSVLFGKGDGTLQPATALAVGSGPSSLTAVGSASGRHASLASTNGNGGSSSAGTEFTLLMNQGSDPPLSGFALASSSPSDTSNVNDMVTLTATLTGASATPPEPTTSVGSSTVTFESGGVALSDCTNVSVVVTDAPNSISTATCTTQMLTAGSDTLTAAYGGDGNYGAINSDDPSFGTTGTVAQTVKALSATLSFSTPSPSASVTVGTSVTFTAQLAASALTPITPDGTITFTINGSSSSDCPAVAVTLTGGVVSAKCTTSSLVAPADIVSATYTGDQNFTVATAAMSSESVSKAAAQTSLASSPVSPVVNQTTTFTATVLAPGGAGASVQPSGSVTFTQGATTLCAAATINTSTHAATCSYAFSSVIASPGSTITATYSGDQNFTAGTAGSVTEIVNTASTTTTVVSSPNPSAVNTQVTFTATVTPAFTAGGTKPTGTVTFTNTTSSTILCTETLSGETVPVCNYTFTTAGAYDVVATYTSGDTNFSGGASGATADVQSVGAGTTSVTLTSSPSPSFVNQQVTFNATINFVTSGTGQPTGTVIYYDAGVQLTNCSFTGTLAAPFTAGSVPPCTVALLTQGTHSITAQYSGDSNFSKSTGSLSQKVNSTTTTTTVTSSPNPSAVNAQVTFTAAVTPGYAGTTKPTGTLVYSNTSTNPATQLCSVTLSGGVVPDCNYTFTASGTYDVVATYTSGDTNFVSSASGATADAQSVGSGLTSVNVTQLPPSTVSQQVTFTATVNFISTGKAVPTGTVAFTDGLAGATPLPAACLTATATANTAGTSVTATCTATLFKAGTHPITAVYSGDSNFHTSTSSIMNQVVNQAATTATASGPSTASVNQSVTFTAAVTTTLTPAGYIAPTGTVTFSYRLNGGASVPLCNATAYSLAAASSTGCVTALPSNGAYSVIAIYSGDSNYLGSTGTGSSSIPLTVTVGATATTLSVMSSSPTITATQNVTFTAIVSQAILGPSVTSPTGSVAFSSSDVSATAPNGTLGRFCPSVALNAVVGGTATATCPVSFSPATGGTVTVQATYTPTAGNLNFRGSSTALPQLAEVVQDFSVAFSAPASGAQVLLTQGFSNATDPLAPQKIAVGLTTAGTFSDQLNLTCTVTNTATNTPVTDPSCSVSPAYFIPTAETSGIYTPASTTVTVTASTTAAVGAYTVALTALDSKVSTLAQTTATPVTVYVVGVSTALSLAPGATGTADAVFDTSTPASGKVPTKLGGFTCGSIVPFVNGVPGKPLANTGLLTCTGPASAPVTGAQTTVTISISPVDKTAQLQRSSTITLAGLLGVPFLALMGWIGGRKASRRNFFRFIGLILLAVGLSYATGCGVGFTPPTQPPGSAIDAGSYYVQVVATDQNGVQYFAVVPLTVNQ